MLLSPIAVLDQSLKMFVLGAAIIGPLSIIGVLLLLKRIERENPERIRWR